MTARALSDRILTHAALHGPFRMAASRRAARRGLGAVALGGGMQLEALVPLGLYASAAEAADPGVRAIGFAGLGRIGRAREVWREADDPTPALRRSLAVAAAPFAPDWALELLPPQAAAERLACRLAVADAATAIGLTPPPPTSRENRLLAAAVHRVNGCCRNQRRALNALFAADRLETALEEEDAPPALDAFSADVAPIDREGPLVSIIMAARDAADTLETALTSLRRQSWTALEILLIDDGSTDDTLAIGRRLAEADPRIRVHTNQGAPGAYGARNTGVALARGDVIAFHDADDWAHPRRIERQLAGLSGGRLASVCGYFRLDDDGRIVNPRVFPLLRLNPILMMARRETFERLGPFDEGRTGGDSEMLARLDALAGRWRVRRMPEPLVVARWSAASLMGASNTGLTPEGAAARVAYVEQWRRRHLQMLQAGLAWNRP